MNLTNAWAFRALAPNADKGSGDTTTEAEPQQEMTETTDVTPDDPDAVKASDVLKAFEEDKTEKESTDEAEEDEVDESEFDEDDADETADEESDEPEDDKEEERFSLDPAVRKALESSDPKALKRLDQQIKGLRKKDAEIQAATETLNIANSYFSAFQDPAHAGMALSQLVQAVATNHGTTPEELLGFKPGPSDTEALADPDSDDAWLNSEYNSPSEYKFARQLEESLKRVEALEKERDAEKKEREAARRKQAEEAHLDTVAPRTIARLAKKDSGWTVTKEMVATAIRNLPQLKDSPEEAVRKWYSDERAKHYAELGTKTAKKGPEAFPANGKTPRAMPSDPSEIRASDILASL